MHWLYDIHRTISSWHHALETRMHQYMLYNPMNRIICSCIPYKHWNSSKHNSEHLPPPCTVLVNNLMIGLSQHREYSLAYGVLWALSCKAMQASTDRRIQVILFWTASDWWVRINSFYCSPVLAYLLWLVTVVNTVHSPEIHQFSKCISTDTT